MDTAYALFAEHYAETDRARFERDLEDKQLVIVLEDARDGSLRGFSTIHMSDRRDADDRRCTVLFSGDTVIHRDYWGQKQLQRAFSMLLLRRKLRHPRKPLYWFLISKGYRTYLLVVNHAKHAIPRHDAPASPRLQRMLDLVATERFGAHYDPVAGLVRWSEAERHEHVREGMSEIPRSLIERNPHVALFAQRNPNYARGDELACIADMTLWTMLRETGRVSIAATIRLVRPSARSRRSAARSDAQGHANESVV